jgi:uncharacterized membrane protein YsdA (DUF1294 family)
MSSDFLTGFWIYLFIVNVVLFLLMGVDKINAIRNRQRIPEAVLILLAALGGAMGGTLGMVSFRHKTKHRKFTILFPLFLLLYAALVVFLISRL